MTNPISSVDPDGLLEYSVVFTDRSLNHMSGSFQQVMRDISSTLKKVYGANSVAIVPGGGTYAMEAVARQFATDNKFRSRVTTRMTDTKDNRRCRPFPCRLRVWNFTPGRSNISVQREALIE